MVQSLKTVAWNTNTLHQQMKEAKMFILNDKVDIMLISEIHLTKKYYSKYHLIQYTMQHVQRYSTW